MNGQAIRSSATDLLRGFWRRRAGIEGAPQDLADWFPVQVELIATAVLRLELRFVPEILSEPTSPNALAIEIAGVLERLNGRTRITISEKHRPPYRRYTLAHELGHAVLHDKLVAHRDRPLTGAERSRGDRPEIECEADLFAAELLMPTKYLTVAFAQRFGPQIDGRVPDDGLAAELSIGAQRPVGALDLAKSLRRRSILVAAASGFKGKHFISLSDHFGVTPTAMAIQLEDLRLVR